MDLRYHKRNVNYSEHNYNTWAIQYFKKDRRVCVKPLRSRLEAIQNLQPPTTVKGCRCFAGMVNFLSVFCSELQNY